MTAAMVTKLNGIAEGANKYSLPTASSSTLGGVKIGTGIAISSGVISNSGVRSIATGTSNGTISVNTNGTTANVAIKGLGSAAYTASTAYATAGHTHSYLPLGGGTMTGTLNFANNIGISGLMAGGSDGWTLCGSGADDAGILKLTISDNLASDFFDIVFDDWDADPVTSFRFGGTNTYCYTPLYIQGNKAWHGGNLKYSLSGTTLTITTS